MIPQEPLLVILVKLIDSIPMPPPPSKRERGRPKFYPDRLFLKALVIMIIRHLHQVHELLVVLAEPTTEMKALRAVLTEKGCYPCRRTWERRLKAMPESLPAQIGCLGRYLVRLIQPWAAYGRAAAIDSTALRANGGVWHQKDSDKGEVPHTSIDTEAAWTKSGWHGWVYGWKLHLVSIVAAVWIPLAADLTPANVADSEPAPALVREAPPETHFILGDRHYNAPNVREACEQTDRVLVTTRYGAYPHTDGGVEVRRIFHKLRSLAIENLNEHFKGIFDSHGQVPTKGLVNTRQFALGAILVYQGVTWQKLVLVFDAVAAKWDSADKPQLVLDASTNVLHAVWLRASLLNGIGTQAVYYARSPDGGQTWSTPVKIAEGAVDWPRIALGSANQVYLVWNQARAQSAGKDVSPSVEVWSQYSTDGGQRWSDAARVQGFDQVSGPIGLVSDNAGELYLVGVGQQTSGEDALLYARWDGRAWGENETFGLDQDAAMGNAASAAIVPEAGRLGVVVREWMRLPDSAPPGGGSQSEGPQSGSAQFEVVATGRDVKATTTTAPAPTFTPMPTQTPEPTATPSPTPTALPQVSSIYVPRSANRNLLPLMLGIALAAIIVTGVVAGRVIRTTGHNNMGSRFNAKTPRR